MAKLLTDPIPHEEGAKRIAGMPAVNRAIFDQLHPDLQARAFVITGVEALDVVSRVRDMVAELPAGGDFKDLKGRIFDEISPWLVTSSDPDEQAKQLAAANRRAELLLRLHGWQAYSQTQYELAEANKDVFPFRQYLSSEDARVRPSHAALNKKILPADHPFWENHTPPWEFGCRCDCVPMTAEEVEEIRAAEEKKAPEDKMVLPPEQLREIDLHKRIVKPGGQGFLDIRTPREREGDGYEYRPGDRALSIDQILGRRTPEERRIFEDYAARQKLADGRSLLEWWTGQSAAGAAPAAGVTPAAPVRNLAQIGKDLADFEPEHAKLDAERQIAHAQYRAALNDRSMAIRFPSGQDPAEIARRVDEARKAAHEADAALEAFLEAAREVVSVPPASRGQVTITSRNRAELSAHVRRGANLTARYTAAKYLPTIKAVALPKSTQRAFYRLGEIHVNLNTSLSTVMHEITHGTEMQTPSLLKAARDFLLHRSRGQAPRRLRDLTGYNYDPREVAFEDEWVRRGGDVYSGKDYGNFATEILTMGIERLHRDPIKFRRTDPEYFEFIVRTLQDID